jgi:hypothetical protein
MLRIIVRVAPISPRKQRVFCLALVAFAGTESALLVWQCLHHLPTGPTLWMWPLAWLLSILHAERANPSF